MSHIRMSPSGRTIVIGDADDHRFTDDYDVAFDGQTDFPLTAVIVAPQNSNFYVNGIRYRFTQDYIILGAIARWVSPRFPLEEGFEVTIQYATP